MTPLFVKRESYPNSNIIYMITRFLLSVLMLLPLVGWAQTPVTVTGTVYDGTDEPLIGVSVIVKGTTTGTATGQQALRQATHNILYTAANSVGQDVSSTPIAYWLYILVAVVDVVLVGLCVFYFVRRHQKMKAWKAQGGNA